MKRLNFFLIIIHCAIAFTPYLSGALFAELDVLIMFCFALQFIGNIKDSHFTGILYSLVAVIALMVIYVILGISSSSIGATIASPLSFMFSPLLAMYCFQEFNVRDIKKLLITLLAIAFANLLYNCIVSTANPMLQFYLDGENRARMNIGWTDYSHFAVFLFLSMLCVFQTSKNSHTRIPVLVVMFVSAYYVLICGQRATCVIFMAIMSVILFLSNYKVSKSTYIILLALCSGLCIVFYDQIVRLSMEIIKSERLIDRLSSIENLNAIDDDSFSGRIYFYRISVETFLSSFKNFMFGVGVHPLEDLRFRAVGNVGGHSQIFDLIAQYGILGTALMIVYFKKLKLYYLSLVNGIVEHRQFSILFWGLIILSLMKYSFNPHLSIVLFLIFPLMLYLLREMDANK